MCMHVRFPTEREMLTAPLPEGKVIEGTDFMCLWCQPVNSILGARAFFKENGDPSRFEQPGRFWVALRERCEESDAALRKNRVDLLYTRCNHCDGHGTVGRAS